MSPARPRSINHTLFVPLAGLVIILGLCSGSARAAETGVVKFFGGAGSEGGQFNYGGTPQGIAINQTGAGGASAGDIYVPDRGNNRIQELTASGEFVRAFGLDVGGSGVDVCTVAASCRAGTDSEAAGSVSRPSAIAIDQATGTVYVTGASGPRSNFRIDAFSATGEFEGSFGWNVKVTGGAEELQFCTVESGCKAGSAGSGGGQLSTLTSNPIDYLAVSSLNGHVFLGDYGNERIDEFAPSFEEGEATGISFVRSFADFGGPVAVGQGGTVYSGSLKVNHGIGEAGIVETYSPEGIAKGVLIESPTGHFVDGLAVNESNGDVLAMDSSSLRVYGPSGEPLTTYLEGAANRAFIHGVAVNEESETIYLTTTEPEAGVLVLGEVVPPTVSIEPVSAFTGTTATFRGRVNPEGFFADYRFEYSSDGTRWTALPDEKLTADSEDHTVSQEATGLVGHTDYQVRLVAEKLLNGGKTEARTSFETGAAAPAVSTPSVEGVTDTTADLLAEVNPENEATSYRFECVSQAQFEASGYAEAREVPSDGGSLEAGGAAIQVSAQLSGLRPESAYRCRISAGNPTGDVTGPDTSFATYASQPLGPPDGRAYEQVTPVDKNGGDARGTQFTLRAAADGEAASYLITAGGATEGGGGQHLGAYSALRGAGSWGSHTFWPDVTFGNYAAMIGWSGDLRRDYVVTGKAAEPKILYEQNLETGAMTAIVGGIETPERVHLAGESADGSVALFESEEALASGATAGWNNLYLWSRSAHKLSLADIGPSGTPPFHGAFAGPYDWANNTSKKGGASAGSFGSGYYTQQLHALSADGSTLFFTSYNVNQLYARTGLDTAHPETAQASVSRKTNGTGGGGKDPDGPQKAAFMEATPDGRFVFFTSSEELTDDATTGTEDQGNDLYRYDTQTGELIDIAPDETDVSGADVRGVIGASADGQTAYFVANGALAAGAGAGNCTGTGGTCSVYVWHEGQVGFVAPTGGEREQEGRNWLPADAFSGTGVFRMRTGRVSASGTLLFLSGLSPTSYDSEGKPEFYRYEPGTGLGCVSCNPTGAAPVSGASMQSITAGFAKVSPPSPSWVRNLSADGKRVFFETSDQLVASDVNQTQDVYEWEAKGAGSCEAEGQNGGCLYLISTGESKEPSYFADASEDGSDVFFFTRQQLVRQDTDNLQDLYDARVGGGLPSQNEESRPKCEGESCRGPASTPPPTESAGSASFAGPSNPKPRHAKEKKRHAKKHPRHAHRKHAHHRRKGRRRHHGKWAGKRHTHKARAAR